MKILLVEDERPLASAVTRLLTEAGHTVTWAPDGGVGYESALHGRFDLILLDVLLPKKNGWEILEGLRLNKVNTPILMLTAMDELEDKVRGLEAGADDYLPKPFETPELLARINALHRRDSAQKGGVVVVDDLMVDRRNRRVVRGGKEISLTRREYDLLEALAVNEGRVLSRQTIQSQVWGDEESVSNTVDVFIGTLRKKIDAAFESKLIHTVVGFGYVLRTEE